MFVFANSIIFCISLSFLRFDWMLLFTWYLVVWSFNDLYLWIVFAYFLHFFKSYSELGYYWIVICFHRLDRVFLHISYSCIVCLISYNVVFWVSWSLSSIQLSSWELTECVLLIKIFFWQTQFHVKYWINPAYFCEAYY